MTTGGFDEGQSYMIDYGVMTDIDPRCNNCGYESSDLDEATEFCYNCQSAYMKGYNDAKLGI